MKKIICAFFLLIVCYGFNNSNAAVGDTSFVQAQNAMHMSWYGEYNAWGVFPPAGATYSKALLDFKLSCPSIGCSDWDYTVYVEALHRTGTYDSTLQQAPSYTVNGAVVDPFYFNTDTAFVSYYDATGQTTAYSPAPPLHLLIYGNTQQPTTATDSMWVWPGNYYNYLYDNTGAVYDSVLVGNDSSWTVTYTPYYNVFEVIQNIELARCITPYGGNYAVTWNNTWVFDVTDYQDILRDSVELRAFYSGYSDGFSITLNFKMIEGTPPRNVVRIRNMYSNGVRSFSYGKTSDPIESHHPSKNFDIQPNEQMAVMRVIPSGHGAGTSNCAEFCNRSYHILVDGVQTFNQQVWRSDCGMNSLYHQAGTWIYDRANWCPGDKVLIKNYDLTPLITPGNPVDIDMNFDSYTNSVAGQDPQYIMSTQLITYGAPNFTTDATVDDIIAPNDFYNYNHFNPICNHPIVIIKNTGSSPLTSAVIHYGIEGGVMNSFSWSGNLSFLDTAKVTLGDITWGSTTGTPGRFVAYIDQPNGGTDQYAYNDTMRSSVLFTPMYPSTFAIVFKTNNVAAETTWKLRDDNGNILYERSSGLAANTVYRDTVILANGCYDFTMNDSGKDGLSFFANSDGSGYCRFQQANGTPYYIQMFQADFGTSIGQKFTVGFTTGMEEHLSFDPFFNVFPNPASSMITLDIGLAKQGDIEIAMYSATGVKVYGKELKNFYSDIFAVDLSQNAAGVYYVRLKCNEKVYTKKVLLIKE